MHEFHITQGLLQAALEAAQHAGAGRITAIDLVLGELSGIVEDSVQLHFALLSQGTLAQDACLRFRQEAALATCTDCGQQREVQSPLLPRCAACGQNTLQIVAGRTCYVESLEMET